jgi:hypothetical protein
MTFIRRVRMRVGDAEFEADVTSDRVQEMYGRFLSVLEQRAGAPMDPGLLHGIAAGANLPADHGGRREHVGQPEHLGQREVEREDLFRIFDLRGDGVIALKALPRDADRSVQTLLLILYGYRRLKSEPVVLATRLRRAAEQSGMSIPVRWPAYQLAIHDRFIVRSGQRKASNYALNPDGVAMASEITSRMLQQAVN